MQCSKFEVLMFFILFAFSSASYHEQYRVPQTSTDKWESYVFNTKEYIIQNFPVNWENAKILCRGHHNGSLAVLDTKEKADFIAEALSESQFLLESVWVGARRNSADDPAGYRWGPGMELRRTAADVLLGEQDRDIGRHYPMWLNRTRVPVPEAGADCVALERVYHDRPVYVDLACSLERPFVCEREAQNQIRVSKLDVVRCSAGLYHVYNGMMNWHQAAAYCLLHNMSLADIATMRCLKKLGRSMLKTRPSIENAWLGARGTLGHWYWVDTGVSIFQAPAFTDAQSGQWPPMRDRSEVKQSGCLQLDRHSANPPVFLEARCERKMQFICFKGAPALKTTPAPPSDDIYNYVLIKQLMYWQHAYENCQRLNGTLASVDNNDVLIQLLLLMGENKDQPIGHIWISGRLNMTKDATENINYVWYNPANGKRIYDSLQNEISYGLYVPPWLDEEFSMDNSCLNLDRQDHLNGLVYGLPCDTPQYSI
ncbi:macrophage mannose receptor 1-like isoform X2 [Galleria mellonella]|nr:macrophage mannose receptor 1-like isoform X2 [Galleria mellonella]